MSTTGGSDTDREWQERNAGTYLADFVRSAMRGSITGELSKSAEALQNFLRISSNDLRLYSVIEHAVQELGLGDPTPEAEEFEDTPERLLHKVLEEAVRIYLEKTTDDGFARGRQTQAKERFENAIIDYIPRLSSRFHKRLAEAMTERAK